jgi:hypothetical protein
LSDSKHFGTDSRRTTRRRRQPKQANVTRTIRCLVSATLWCSSCSCSSGSSSGGGDEPQIALLTRETRPLFVHLTLWDVCQPSVAHVAGNGLARTRMQDRDETDAGVSLMDANSDTARSICSHNHRNYTRVRCPLIGVPSAIRSLLQPVRLGELCAVDRVSYSNIIIIIILLVIIIIIAPVAARLPVCTDRLRSTRAIRFVPVPALRTYEQAGLCRPDPAVHCSRRAPPPQPSSIRSTIRHRTPVRDPRSDSSRANSASRR